MRSLSAMPRVGLILVAAACLTLFSPQSGSAECGDFDGNGVLSAGDVVAMFQYLFQSGVAPFDYDEADFDLHDQFTFNDVARFWSCILICDFPDVYCPPTEPPLVLAVDPDFKISYPESVPANVTNYEIDIEADATFESLAICLPLRLRINGQVPQIDSVIVPEASSYAESSGNIPIQLAETVEADFGIIIIAGAKQTTSSETRDHLATVFVTVTPQSAAQPIDLQFVEWMPTQAAEGEENSVFPMYLPSPYSSQDMLPLEPLLEADCCTVAGDLDGNGRVNIGDAVQIVCYLFGMCSEIGICVDTYDADGSGAVSISDAVYIISYIFAGGPAPVCGPQ